MSKCFFFINGEIVVLSIAAFQLHDTYSTLLDSIHFFAHFHWPTLVPGIWHPAPFLVPLHSGSKHAEVIPNDNVNLWTKCRAPPPYCTQTAHTHALPVWAEEFNLLTSLWQLSQLDLSFPSALHCNVPPTLQRSASLSANSWLSDSHLSDTCMQSETFCACNYSKPEQQ